MAEKKDYIALCRYYKGEDACPLSGEKALLWDYEKRWVEMHMSASSVLSDFLDDYAGVGLAAFSLYDGVPLTLQALLFNRFCHTMSGAQYECVEDFKEWFSTHYL